MKVIGLDGREYKMNLSGKQILLNETRPRSEGHLRCRKLLKELYPVSPILEEVKLEGTNSLRVDFFLPQQMLACELNGVQHYKFVAHFHGNKQGFLKAKKNDKDKKEWMLLNNIRLVELADTDDEECWRGIILDEL
jgi:hypothetical protein